jgi:hypothetical protein
MGYDSFMNSRMDKTNARERKKESSDETAPREEINDIQRRLKSFTKDARETADIRKPKPGKGI